MKTVNQLYGPKFNHSVTWENGHIVKVTTWTTGEPKTETARLEFPERS